MRSHVKVDIAVNRSITVAYADEIDTHLELAKMLRDMPQKCDWGRHVAHIPLIVLQQWYNEALEHGHDVRMFSREFEETIIREKLKDPEWAHLRTDGPRFNVGWGD